MNVSRETSLSNFLSTVANALQIDRTLVLSGHTFSGLTASAVNIILLTFDSLINKPLLVLSESVGTAEKFYSASFNLLSNRSTFFPSILNNALNIPGFNLENERYRSEATNHVRGDIPGLVFSSTDIANETVIADIVGISPSFDLLVGEEIDRQELLSSFALWGYEQTDHTETPKTFSLRGGILDVFLPYSANPTRIEFFGNLIESIRIFNPRSQRTINSIDSIEISPPPMFNNNSEHKISLLDLFDSNIVKILKINSEYYNIKIGCNQYNNNDLSCKMVSMESSPASIPGLSLNTAIKGVRPQNVFLFSENTIPQKFLEEYSLQDVTVVPHLLGSGFYSEKLGLLCLSVFELTKQKPLMRSRWTVDSVAEIPQKEFSSLEELDWGDFLVHQDFGIGLYRGLDKIITHSGVEQECIKIEYANNSNVLVPVEKFNRVHRMIFTGDKNPVLSTLNSPKWSRQKQIAKDSAKIVMQDLVNLYSSRSQERGFKYIKNNNFMDELEISFPYEETSGQKDAIDAVFSDMEKEFPVDRLVCGDVGFGKTEVALRAALKSIISGKKVLFLTPTTILADQHFISTKARLEPLGVRVDLLSRFKTKKQQQEILEKMLNGSADLVIGTHRLLSKDVNFPELGLLIIDEEHRFGVKHKEKIRQLRTNLDVLTLTATPIPRTLQQSLLGIRDISQINTPPKTRRPIKTFVQYFNWDNIKIIVNNELMRNGQVYYLHNDIASIPFIFKKLSSLFPSRIIGVAHSKMNTKDLENTVLAFFGGNIDILLCTTIIESGLDVANANTLIINNAQNFGLSQLYQIRGRVGRSHQQAYCYLLLPQGKTIGEVASKRLKAIEQFTSLGSGYDISLKDLEIRGAGNLFGYKQSGHIAAVGFEMYCKLLQEAVDESLGKADSQKLQTKISIPYNALLESDFIPLVQDRLHFYQKLAEATVISDVINTQNELADRYGRLPDATIRLLDITKLRIKLSGTAVRSLSVIGSDLKIGLSGYSPFSSVPELISAIEQKLSINDLDFQFSNNSDGLLITISTGGLNHALKIIGLFVELFSK